MNIPSQISFYDLLCMMLPGFVILWIIGFCGLDLNVPIQCAFVVILCYPIGLVYHRLIEELFKWSKKYWKSSMLQHTWDDENKKLAEKDQLKYCVINERDYIKAYYNVVINNCRINISILESQEAFIRNGFLLILLSICKLCCCYSMQPWLCRVVILLIIILVASFFAWISTQKKIFKLVWEADNNLRILKSEDKRKIE